MITELVEADGRVSCLATEGHVRANQADQSQF